MGLFDKHQALVGRGQGASRLFVRIGGFFNVGDEASADGTDITGLQLKNTLLAQLTRTTYAIVSAALATSVMTPKYGLFLFSAGAGISTCSIKLPSAEPGALLMLNLGAIQSDFQILAGDSPSIAGIRGSDLSRINIVNGSVNSAFLELCCYTQGEWQVARTSNRTGVVEQPSS